MGNKYIEYILLGLNGNVMSPETKKAKKKATHQNLPSINSKPACYQLKNLPCINSKLPTLQTAQIADLLQLTGARHLYRPWPPARRLQPGHRPWSTRGRGRCHRSGPRSSRREPPTLALNFPELPKILN